MKLSSLAGLTILSYLLFPLVLTNRDLPKLYVAIGDSFAAGNGAGDPEDPTGRNSCRRSHNAYPNLFASRGNQVKTFQNLACSAVTPEAVLGQASRIPPNAELVSVTTGMEFISMASVVYQCDEQFEKSVCISDVGPLVSAEAQAQQPYYAYLKNLIATIQRRAPQALTVILGYPRWYGSPVANCITHPGGPGPVDGPIKDRVNALPFTLQTQAFAAADSSEGVIYRDVDHDFSWHRYCDGGVTQWFIKHQELRTERSGWIEYGYFHPTSQGHSAYADELQDAWDKAEGVW